MGLGLSHVRHEILKIVGPPSTPAKLLAVINKVQMGPLLTAAGWYDTSPVKVVIPMHLSSLYPIVRIRRPFNRRWTARLPMHIPATLRVNSQSSSATITNLSPNGVGLSDVDQRLVWGDVVAITTADGVTIFGEVRWYRDGSAGLQRTGLN